MWGEYKVGITSLLVLLLFIVSVIAYFLYKDNQTLRFTNRSTNVKFGKYTEQFMPILEEYPYDKTKFRFIGSPIDGVQFEKDRIIFIEFKTNDSQLSERQKSIRQLVKGGKIEWDEIRIPPTK